MISGGLLEPVPVITPEGANRHRGRSNTGAISKRIETTDAPGREMAMRRSISFALNGKQKHRDRRSKAGCLRPGSGRYCESRWLAPADGRQYHHGTGLRPGRGSTLQEWCRARPQLRHLPDPAFFFQQARRAEKTRVDVPESRRSRRSRSLLRGDLPETRFRIASICRLRGTRDFCLFDVLSPEWEYLRVQFPQQSVRPRSPLLHGCYDFPRL
jgi:hypothetical protein